MGKPALGILIEGLEKYGDIGNEEVKLLIVKLLGEIGGQEAEEALIRALKREPDKLSAVHQSLLKLDTPAAQRALSEYESHYEAVTMLIQDALAIERGILVGPEIGNWFAAVGRLGKVEDLRAWDTLVHLKDITEGGARLAVENALAERHRRMDVERKKSLRSGRDKDN